jgi:hypothetical protein
MRRLDWKPIKDLNTCPCGKCFFLGLLFLV